MASMEVESTARAQYSHRSRVASWNYMYMDYYLFDGIRLIDCGIISSAGIVGYIRRWGINTNLM